MQSKCSACGTPLVRASDADLWHCPDCGRRFRRRTTPVDRSEDPGFTASSETPENVSSSHSSEGISPSGTPRSESSYASGDVSPSGTPVRLPWSGWAWAAFVVGAIASLAPPFRLLWDLAAIVLALIARHRIMGGPGWALTAARPRARGIWLANVAFLLGALDLFLVAWFTL